MPKGWAAYAFFQKSQDGTVNGIAGKIDVDFFNGDIDALTAMTQPLTSSAAAFRPRNLRPENHG